MLDKQLWYQIEENLGEITDFEISNKNGFTEIRYKSNGQPKIDYIKGSDLKILIQSFHYCIELGSAKGQLKPSF